MSTEELAELFLTHLYDLSEAAPHPNFLFSVNDFAPRFGITDLKELQKATQYLGDRGLIILASFDTFGGISAGITIEGSVFVENGGETGIIGEYRKDPQVYVREPAELAEEMELPSPPARAAGQAGSLAAPVHVVTPSEGENVFYAGRAVEAILADMEEMLDRDRQVPESLKADVLSDLATLRIQISRNVKNKAVISAMLESLASVPSIAPLVTALDCIVAAYFK